MLELFGEFARPRFLDRRLPKQSRGNDVLRVTDAQTRQEEQDAREPEGSENRDERREDLPTQATNLPPSNRTPS